MRKIVMILLAVFVLSGCESRQETATTAPQGQGATPTVTVDAQQPVDYYQQGLAYLKEVNPSAAIQSFDEAIKQNPLNPQNYIILGQTYMRLQDFSRAIDSLSAGLRVAPNRGDIHYLLSVNYGLVGDMSLAKKNAQRSVEIFRANKDEENFMKSLALLQGLLQREETLEKSAKMQAAGITPEDVAVNQE